MLTCARNDALRLLRAINMDQAHGRVGATVFAFDAGRTAGLQPGTERYDEALWYLLWEGALTANEFPLPEVAATMPFGRAPYKLTPKAILMLEQG